jgi:hypothetical protein
VAKVHPLVEREGGPVLAWMIQCPACGNGHKFDVGRWQFNGNVDRPTFLPSMLVQSGHYIPGHQGDCWCTYNAEHPDGPAPFTCVSCHSFVRDGRIEFLSDCTHELAGKTVDLEDW